MTLRINMDIVCHLGASANDTKADKRNLFNEIHITQYMRLECLMTLHFGLANEVCGSW